MKYRFSIGHSLTLGRFRIKLLGRGRPYPSLFPLAINDSAIHRPNRPPMEIETFTSHLEGGGIGLWRKSTVVIPNSDFMATAKKNGRSIRLFLFVNPLFPLRYLRSVPLYPLWKSVNETEHTDLVACRSSCRIASTLIGKLSSCPALYLFPFACFSFLVKSGIYIQRYTIRPNNLCDFSPSRGPLNGPNDLANWRFLIEYSRPLPNE